MHKPIELVRLEWQNINKQYFYTVSICLYKTKRGKIDERSETFRLL